MAKSKVNQEPILLPSDPEAWREGLRRALAMLRDLESVSADDTDCKDDCRGGRPQENVVYGHLLGIISTRSDAILAAFSSVLTHYMGNAAHGGIPDIDDGPSPISREMRAPIRTQLGRPTRARIAMRPFGKEALNG